MECGYILSNFGGPRSLDEIRPFLKALLTDRDVIRTKLPKLAQIYLFSKVAKKRAVEIAPDYVSIGGKSPIYEDTEFIAEKLREKLNAPLIAFHRYIPSTHKAFIKAVEEMDAEEICIFPMFPQFSYATTGSIARFFSKNFSKKTCKKLKWIKSYSGHSAYLSYFTQCIKKFLSKCNLQEEETMLFYSAHGLPLKFIETGDPYLQECKKTFEALSQSFPQANNLIAFQSKFGPGEWLRPYTDEVCKNIFEKNKGRQNVVFIPLSFTSDHIETLFEIEQLYVATVNKKGLNAIRMPSFNQDIDWIETIIQILKNSSVCDNGQLIYQK